MPRRARKTRAQSSDTERTISAQVIVRSASGKPIDGSVPITSENVSDYAPASDDVQAAQSAFRETGFEVGPLVGISFSIAAPLTRFEKTFGTKLRVDERGAVARVESDAPGGGLELPLAQLPRHLADRLVTVAFSPPADLHGSGSLFV